jgi:hypothetical protein
MKSRSMTALLRVPRTRIVWLLLLLGKTIRVGPGKQEDLGEPFQDMFGAWSFAGIGAAHEDRAIAPVLYCVIRQKKASPWGCCLVLTGHHIYKHLPVSVSSPQDRSNDEHSRLDDRGCCSIHQPNVRDGWELAEENLGPTLKSASSVGRNFRPVHSHLSPSHTPSLCVGRLQQSDSST